MDTFEKPNEIPNEIPEEELIFESEDGTATFEEKLQKLKERLKRCESDRGEYLAGWQRAKADFLNARREEEKQRASAHEFAEMEFLRELIPLLDSFRKAFEQAAQWQKTDEQWRLGIEGIRGQLQQILERHNVRTFASKGEPFDPSVHEALEVTDTDKESEHQMVLEELRPGYFFNERLLRPAQVRVGEWKKEKESP